VLFSEQAAVKIIAAHSKLKVNDFMEFPLSLRIAREMYLTFRKYSVENRMVRRVRFWLRFQPVNATHWLKRSAGVRYSNVFLGRGT
jgi:hypothetical protein